jgi:hypothetical protein
MRPHGDPFQHTAGPPLLKEWWVRCTGTFLYIRYSFLLISNKFCDLKGPKLEIFGSGVLTQIRPVWVGDLGTGPKNPKLGWFRPKNRQFILFSAVRYNAKDF